METWRPSWHTSLLSGERTEFLHPLWIYTLDLVLCPLPVPCSEQANGASKLGSMVAFWLQKPEALEGGSVGKDV